MKLKSLGNSTCIIFCRDFEKRPVFIMPRHTEQFHIRSIHEDHLTPLLNHHHARVGFFYHDRSLRKYVVQAGPRTKSRLEFLLENDAELKKAIRKDDVDSNRCNKRDFVEKDMNKVRGRTPIARLNQSVEYMNLKQLSSYLRNEVMNDHVDAAAAAGKKPKMKLKYGKKEFEPSWWKHVAHLLEWRHIRCYFEHITVEEFNTIKGQDCDRLGLTNLTKCLKEVVCILLRVNNIDPDSHVIQNYNKKALNYKRRVKGKKFLPANSSTSGSSTSGSSGSSSGSGSSSSISSYFPSQPILPLTGQSRNQIRASVQRLINPRTPLPPTSQPPLPPTSQPPLPPASQPPLPPTSLSSQPPSILSESFLNADLPLITLESPDSSMFDTLPRPKTPPRQAHPSSPMNMFNHTRSKEEISNQDYRLLLDAGNKKKQKRKP